MEIGDQSYKRQIKIARELDEFLFQVGVNKNNNKQNNDSHKQLKVSFILKLGSMINIS